MNNVQAIERVIASSERRIAQRDKLIVCAEAAIARDGLDALRARDLAACAGCAVGGIYNLVADLDELVLRVGRRTMAELNRRLDAVTEAAPLGAPRSVEALLVGWALAYRRFATDNRNLWRALFELRLPAGRDLPDWFQADQLRLFVRLETALATLDPDLDASARGRRARTLFSAVHGIVVLGLEEKLVAMSPSALNDELTAFVRVYLAGLQAVSTRTRG